MGLGYDRQDGFTEALQKSLNFELCADRLSVTDKQAKWGLGVSVL